VSLLHICLLFILLSAALSWIDCHVNGAMQAPKVIGSSGKILKSGPNDRVFVYYADHGAPGETVPRSLTCLHDAKSHSVDVQPVWHL
jgi:hypothetical protein